MGIDDLVSPSPQDEVPTVAEDPRLDYAWKWFNFHAEQRTKMFNYMLVGLGILATAIATMAQKALWPEAICLSGAGVIICVAFYFIDYRNRYLYSLAQAVLLNIEKSQLFVGDAEIGIVKELTKPEGRSKPLSPTRGRHRFWMPFVIAVFAVLFAAAIGGALYKRSHPDDTAIPDKAVLINEAVSSQNTNGSTDPTRNGALFETVRFGGFVEGRDDYSCTNPANAAVIERINNAIRSAQTLNLQPILFLVGSTDRAVLSSSLRKQFEANTGLARARVTAVEQCLTLTAGGSHQPVVMRLVTGPSYTPRISGAKKNASNVSAAQDQDREVQALVVGIQAARPSGGD